MSLEQLLPGSSKTLGAIGVTLVALLLVVGVCGYCAGERHVNRTDLESAIAKGKDSIRVLDRARAAAVQEAAAAHQAVAQAHLETVSALAHADSVSAHAEALATAAERHR